MSIQSWPPLPEMIESFEETQDCDPEKIKEKKESMNSASVWRVFHHEKKRFIALDRERLRLPGLQRGPGRLQSSTAGAANGLVFFLSIQQGERSLTLGLVCHLLLFCVGPYDFRDAENMNSIAEFDNNNGINCKRGILWNLPKCGCNL